MLQKPKFTHSAPLTADALAVLFKALSCETSREAMNKARAILLSSGARMTQVMRINREEASMPYRDRRYSPLVVQVHRRHHGRDGHQ